MNNSFQIVDIEMSDYFVYVCRLKPKNEEDNQNDNVYDASTDEEGGAVNRSSGM